jgi:hypothetical protein
VIIVSMAQAAIHLVDVNVIKRLRVLLLDKLHADVDEMTHHLHDMGIITREQRDTILIASNAPMQRCRNVLDLLVYRNGFFDSFVYCLEIMGKMNLARLLRLYRTATQQGLPTTCLLSKFIEDGGDKTTTATATAAAAAGFEHNAERPDGAHDTHGTRTARIEHDACLQQQRRWQRTTL